MELDQFKTRVEYLGQKRLNPFQSTNEYRIFVERGGNRFSLVINGASEPNHNQIVAFFLQHSKEFFLDV